MTAASHYSLTNCLTDSALIALTMADIPKNIQLKEVDKYIWQLGKDYFPKSFSNPR